MIRPALELVFALAVLVTTGQAQDQQGHAKASPVRVHTEAALPGYTLIAPLNSLETLLVDLQGRVVHRWKSEFTPGQSAYLLDNGHLLRCARDPGETPFRGGGEGGRVEEFDWDGKLVWSYQYCDAQHRQHHDIEPMRNGHVLLIAWEAKTKDEVLAAGRDAEAAEQGLWPDSVIEVEPIRPKGGKIVWEWHVWDHIIQDRDRNLANFGVVADHPELLDINANRPTPKAKPPQMSDEEIARLQALGYLGANSKKDADGERGGRGGRGRGFGGMGADWNHVNAVAYNAELDQILLSSHNQNEIWVIDHGTTTKEAAGHGGGKRGRGGDFLYRWGNPATYHRGTAKEQILSGQHDARWIEQGQLGEGHILVFNNGVTEGFGFGPGADRNAKTFSSVIEFAPPLAADGSYACPTKDRFGPAEAVWTFSDHESDPPMFSPVISGAQRLANDNTLICSGVQNRVLEVTPEGEIVWDFRNPFGGDAPMGGGFFGGAGPPPGGGFGGPPGGAAGGSAGGPTAGAGAPPGRRGRDGGGRGGPGGPGGFGGPGGPGGFGGIFRATRIGLDHPALQGRKLEPLPEAVKKPD